MTRGGELDKVLRVINDALEAGLRVKINAVPVRGWNEAGLTELAAMARDRDICVRFIELMPMLDNPDFDERAFIPCTRVLEALPEVEPVKQDGGVARLYRLPDAQGNIGLISPVSAHFCGDCNRLRLTADGKIKPCLHSAEELSLKGLDREGMRAQLETAIWHKPQWHGDLDALHHSQAGRSMNQIGG